MINFTNKSWINECKESIRIAFPILGEEYIAEAEHQDGEGCWMMFETISSVLYDVQQYHQSNKALQLQLGHCLDLVNNDYADVIADSHDQPDDIKANFASGLLIINKMCGRLYPANPCHSCACDTCSDCADCYGCKQYVNKNPNCRKHQ